MPEQVTDLKQYMEGFKSLSDLYEYLLSRPIEELKYGRAIYLARATDYSIGQAYYLDWIIELRAKARATA